MRQEPKEPPLTRLKLRGGGDKQKRKLTGYQVFCREAREEVECMMMMQLEEGEEVPPRAVVKELAAQWKALSKEDQGAWKRLAAAESDEE